MEVDDPVGREVLQENGEDPTVATNTASAVNGDLTNGVETHSVGDENEAYGRLEGRANDSLHSSQGDLAVKMEWGVFKESRNYVVQMGEFMLNHRIKELAGEA